MILPISGKFADFGPNLGKSEYVFCRETLNFAQNPRFRNPEKWTLRNSLCPFASVVPTCATVHSNFFATLFEPFVCNFVYNLVSNHRCHLVAKSGAFGSKQFASSPVVTWVWTGFQPLVQAVLHPRFKPRCKQKKHRDVTLGVCKLGLEPWFTQGGTVGAKLHGELFFVAQYTFFTPFWQVLLNEKVHSC